MSGIHIQNRKRCPRTIYLYLTNPSMSFQRKSTKPYKLILSALQPRCVNCKSQKVYLPLLCFILQFHWVTFYHQIMSLNGCPGLIFITEKDAVNDSQASIQWHCFSDKKSPSEIQWHFWMLTVKQWNCVHSFHHLNCLPLSVAKL